jgi:ABC-2 type transport system permease protein
MSQITATLVRIIKELIRDRAVIFWSVFFPIVLLLMANFVSMANVSASERAVGTGFFTLAMIVYATMMAGMVDIPANISHDRNRGMLIKLKSMPVSQTKDFIGRILAFLVFSLIAIVIVLVIGILLGAGFSVTPIGLVESIAFLFLPILASSGIGLILGTLIESEQGAAFTGIGLALITSFTSGIFSAYSNLPSILQSFSRIYPISSSVYSLTYLLVGQKMAGYNPLELGQILATVLSSLILFTIGLVLYTRYCWRKE